MVFFFSNITEEWKIKDVNAALKKNLRVPHDLDGVFIDSYYYPDSEQEAEAFNRETTKLWDFFSNKEQFTFKSMQDILDELHECKEETAKGNKYF